MICPAAKKVKRLTAPDIRARKNGRADRLDHVHTRADAGLMDQICDLILVGEFARHGDARQETEQCGHADMMHTAGPRGDARIQARRMLVVDICRSDRMKAAKRGKNHV